MIKSNPTSKDTELGLKFIYLSFRAFWAKALNLEESWSAAFLVSNMRFWSHSPNGLFAMAFTAVKGIAEKTNTPASW